MAILNSIFVLWCLFLKSLKNFLEKENKREDIDKNLRDENKRNKPEWININSPNK